MTFGFDERYAMFDVTPVDNQFILECIPQAKGDYVRVYLYGLVSCYHPEVNISLEQMCHDLDLPEEEISRAYRNWERRRLVRRISDDPPMWQYVRTQGKINDPDAGIDPAYEAFAEALYGVFDNNRRLHGKEIETCYEWVEDLHLPMEAVIMLLKHMARNKGKNFSIQSAGRIALEMADAQVRTLEDAEAFLSQDQQINEGVRKILRKLGKRGLASEAQTEMYRKWIQEWHFSPEAVEYACADTAKGDPSMGYLDGILRNVRQAIPGSEPIDRQRYDEIRNRREQHKAVLDILGSGNMTEENVLAVAEMEKTYPIGVILIGARECAATHKNVADLKALLEAWRGKGFTTQEEVEAYVKEFKRQNELLKRLREKWNAGEPRIGETSRKMVNRWEKEWGFDEEMILKAAEYASEAKAPMAYLDSILNSFREKNIRTPEEADKEQIKMKSSFSAGRESAGNRLVTAQQYTQREYSDEAESPEEMLARLKEEIDNA